jgi:nicotinate-nucleotide pyrophosphorylase (carboxylating)
MSRHRADDDARAPWQEGTREALAAAGLDLTWTRDLVLRTLSEDLGPLWRDVTTFATIPADQTSVAQIVARAPGTVAGLPLLPVVLAEAAARLSAAVPTADLRVDDGSWVETGDVIAIVTGSTRVILVAERSVLNLIGRAGGIATHTRQWTTALQGTGARVLDTRKTTPGLRALEKYAVRTGGGTNKRMGLYDVAMIKDNHKVAAGSLTAAYQSVHKTFPDVEIQVEVVSPDEAEEAVSAGARFLLCDNMSTELLAETVRRARAATPEPVELEATGGLTVDRARAYAETGVQYLSVGALTHSSSTLDIALDLLAGQAGDPGQAGAAGQRHVTSFTEVWEQVSAEETTGGPALGEGPVTAGEAVVLEPAPSLDPASSVEASADSTEVYQGSDQGSDQETDAAEPSGAVDLTSVEPEASDRPAHEGDGGSDAEPGVSAAPNP